MIELTHPVWTNLNERANELSVQWRNGNHKDVIDALAALPAPACGAMMGALAVSLHATFLFDKAQDVIEDIARTLAGRAWQSALHDGTHVALRAAIEPVDPAREY